MPKVTDTLDTWKEQNRQTLFDNDVHTVMAGDSKEGERVLAIRWNKGDPRWLTVPGFLEVPVLHGLLDELARKPDPDINKRQSLSSLVMSELTQFLAKQSE